MSEPIGPFGGGLLPPAAIPEEIGVDVEVEVEVEVDPDRTQLIVPSPDSPGSYQEVDAGTTAAMPDEEELISILRGYLDEGRDARQTGPESREEVWRLNWERYWGRLDWTGKAEWQHQSRLPEVSNFVERFAAAVRQALVSAGTWFDVSDPLDPKNQINNLVRRIMEAVLDRCSITTNGHRTGFARVFGDVLKSGALMNMAASVTWQKGGVRVEPVDPRDVYLDPSGRRLYRIRKMEVDRYKLLQMAEQKDSEGKPIWHKDRIESLSVSMDMDDREDKNQSSGYDNTSDDTSRRTVLLYEYLCDILTKDGELVAENQLIVMADEMRIIRGPEPNPWWHKQDWIVYSPMITVPFSEYGRTYVEAFRELADTFMEFTNLILDGVFTGSQRAFQVWVQALEDPSQLDSGIHPNKMFVADEDWPPGHDFLKSVEMGRLPPEAFQAWSAIKSELQEAASQNELQLGGLANKSDVTATEIQRAHEGASAIQRAIAQDIEEGFLEPLLELVWWTFLQKFNPDQEPELAQEIGPDITAMLMAQRQDFRKRRFRLKASGISASLQRGERLRGMMGFLNIIGSNQGLTQAFSQQYSMNQLMGVLMKDFGVDPQTIEKTDRERLKEQMMASQMQAQQVAQTQNGGLAATEPSQGAAPGPIGGVGPGV